MLFRNLRLHIREIKNAINKFKKLVSEVPSAELGTQQCLSFATTTMRQRDNVIEPQGQEKFEKYLDLGV